MFNPAPVLFYCVLLMIGLDTIAADTFRVLPIAGLFMAIGISTTVSAARTLRQFSANVAPNNPANELVTAGLFGLSRNPMYLGMLTTLFGVALTTGTVASLAIPVLYGIWIHYCYIRPENAAMAIEFPEYQEYARNVRAWI